jgi:hypothetical protein
MPLSALAEVILQPVFEVILHVFGYLTGVVVVPVCTLGAFKVEPILREEKGRPRPKLRKMRAEMTQPRVISADAGSAFGLLFWALVAVAIYLLKYHL